MHVIWILISLWTGGDGEDYYRFESPTFTSQQHCIDYVKQNWNGINKHVNDAYNSEHPFPNTFHCIKEKEWEKHSNTNGKSI